MYKGCAGTTFGSNKPGKEGIHHLLGFEVFGELVRSSEQHSKEGRDSPPLLRAPVLGILSLTRTHLAVPILAVCDFYYLSETEFQRDSGAQTKHKLKYPPRRHLSNIETICQLRRARNSQQSSHKLKGGREGNLLALLCFRSVHQRNPENTEILVVSA